MELKGEGGGSLLHPQPDPLQWGEGARPGRGRGAPGAGLEALAEVLPGGGNRDGRRRFWRFLGRGCGWLRAPHTPGKGEAGGSGGLRPRPPAGSPRARPLSRRSLAGSAAGRGWELGKGDPEPAVRGRSGLQLVPLCHRLPRAGDHVLPVLHLTGTALPGQVNLRETHPWSHRGRSIPVPLPGTGAFTPQTAPAPLFRARHGAGLFLSLDFSIWHRGKARVPALAAAAATSGSRCHRSGSADHRRRAGMEHSC